MPINSIQSYDNKTQNNLTALASGICVGTAGAITGYNIAPRAAKNMDQLLNSSSDVFYKTIDNMQNAKKLDALKNAFLIIPARGASESIETKINTIFPGDKISASDYKKELKNQEKQIKTARAKIDKFIEDITKKKGTNMSLEEYFDTLAEREILPKKTIPIIKQSIVDVIGEDGYKAKTPIDEKMLEIYKSARDIALNITNDEIKIYKNLQKVEKDGFLFKKDMIASAKKDIKPVINDMLTGVSFNDIKEFIPRVAKAKWAAITGVSAGVVSAACVKLFGGNKPSNV